MYLFVTGTIFAFTACSGGTSEETATEEDVEVAVCANTGEPCLADHSCCAISDEDAAACCCGDETCDGSCHDEEADTHKGHDVNIPDANFKAYLVGNTAINTNGDAEIQVSEAIVFNGTINCNNLNISDLTGIEAFTALTNLYCSSNQLTTLDVSNNTALTNLGCQDNQLTSLDLRNGNNTYFVYFYCGDNLLSCIDVDDAAWSAATWVCCYDPQVFFSEDCGAE